MSEDAAGASSAALMAVPPAQPPLSAPPSPDPLSLAIITPSPEQGVLEMAESTVSLTLL